MSSESNELHYVITTWTQTKPHSSTDSKVTVRLHGEHGRTVFVRLNNSHDNFEKGRKDIFSVTGFDNVGVIYKIEISVGSDAWIPEKILVEHLSSGRKTTFTNIKDTAIDNSTLALPCENLVDIDISDSSNKTSNNWLVYDYRASDSEQKVHITKSSHAIKKSVSQTDKDITSQTGLRILNKASIEAGGGIGPKVSSSMEAEFNTQLSISVKNSKILESTSEFTLSSDFYFDAPAATLLFVNYPVHVEYKTGKVTFFDGSEENVAIPQYDKWGLDDIPARRIEVTSDGEMTDELKLIYQNFFGKSWEPEPYKNSESKNLRVA